MKRDARTTSSVQASDSEIPSLVAKRGTDPAYIPSEALSEPSSHLSPESRNLASLLCSKIYFYLGAINDAVNAALNAGDAFTRDSSAGTGEYKETIIGELGWSIFKSDGSLKVSCTAKCLDRCIDDRSKAIATDPRLTSIVSQVMNAGSTEPGKLRAGLALSLRDFDALEEAVRDARKRGNGDELVRYVLAETTGGANGNDSMDVEFVNSVSSGAVGLERGADSFPFQLMRKLLELFEQSSPPDYTSIAQIWLRLNEPALAASTLSKLISGGENENDKLLEAYQIGFDLADTATQEFLGKVIDALPKTEEQEKESEPTALHALKEILSGEKSIRLYLEFLSKNNHSDLLLLKNIKVRPVVSHDS